MIDTTNPTNIEDALAIVGIGYLVLPVEIAQRVCTLLGVSLDAPGPPIVSWQDGDEAWEKCGLAGREGPGQGVESVPLSYYVAAQLGIDSAPGVAFSERLTHGKQAAANMAAIREALLERGVQGPSVLPSRLIPTGWGTYPLQDEMLVGTERTPAELEVLFAHGFFADRKIRSTSGAVILTYRVIWKGQVAGTPAFGNYANGEHNTETRRRKTLAVRGSFEQLRDEWAIDLSAWYWIQVEGEGQEPT